MSEENVEIVRALIDAFNRADFEAVFKRRDAGNPFGGEERVTKHKIGIASPNALPSFSPYCRPNASRGKAKTTARASSTRLPWALPILTASRAVPQSSRPKTSFLLSPPNNEPFHRPR